MTAQIAVGFMLCAVMGAFLAVAWWAVYARLDDHGEQLANLQILVAGWLPEELDEVEPATVEIPVVSDETAPMDLGEQIDADHRALIVREFQGVQFKFRTPVEEQA